MRLKRLNITNFRSHQASAFEFGLFNVLAGQQGAGKTSVLDSITAVLTGRTRLTDRRGAGIRDHIRRGEARLEVELTCQFGTDQPDSLIKRTVTESGQTLEVPFGGKNLSARQALLTERMGGVDEIPDVLLDPRLFADRSPDEQKQALLKLLRPPTIEVPKAAQAVGIQSLVSVQQVDDQIKSIKEGSVRSLNAVIKNLEETMPAEPSPEELAAAHKAQADLSAVETRIAELTSGVTQAEYLLQDAQKLVSEVETARTLAAELPQLRRQYTEVHDDQEAVQKLLDHSAELNRQIQAAEKVDEAVKLAKVAEGRLPDLRTKLEEARAKLKAAVDDYKATQKETEELGKELATATVRTEALRVAIQNIESVDGVCPACSRKMTAKAKAETLATLNAEWETAKATWKDLASKAEANDKKRSEQSAHGAGAKASVDVLAKELSETEHAAGVADIPDQNVDSLRNSFAGTAEAITTYLQKYEGAESATDLIKQLRTLGENTATSIADAERAEKMINSPLPVLSDLEHSLQAKQDELALLSGGNLDTAKEAAAAARDTSHRATESNRIKTELTRHRTQRESYLAAVESLVALKDSILGGESARRMQLDCTDIFQHFFPQARVLLDPSGASVAPIGSNEGTPVAHLSSGQKVIFDMGLRIAAARATGFNVLAIDDANKLAPSAREAMLRCLQASGCQVIMCTTADRIGGIPGAVVYSLTNPGVWGPTKVVRV